MDYWPTESCIFYSPWRRRLETASVSRTSHVKETNTIKTGSKWQGHLVTSPGHLCSMVQFKVDEWLTLGSRPTSWSWGKSFSHPRLLHTHPTTLSCPAAPQIKSLQSRKQQVLSLLSLGYQNQRAKWMFPLRTGTEQKEGNDYSNSSVY